MFLKIKNRSGVTLVELLIAIGLISVITSMIFSFFLQGTKIYSMGNEKSAAHQDTSIAAFSITNTIRNVKEISLSNQPGYSQLDIQSRYPSLSNVEYSITEESGIYSLLFTLTHQEGYSVESKVLLNNVKHATTGSTSADAWFLTSGAAADLPAIAIGASTGTLVEGVSGTITYPVLTANIGNGEHLQVSLNGSPVGLSVNTSPSVMNNSATIIVTGTTAVSSGIYTFSVNYPEASERIGTVFVGQNVPVITLNGDSTMTIVKGSSFIEPGYTAQNSDGTNITSSVVIGGDTVNKDVVGTYVITYNVTNSAGVSAVEVVRTVIVQDSGPGLVTVTGTSHTVTSVTESGNGSNKIYTVKANVYINLSNGTNYEHGEATVTIEREGSPPNWPTSKIVTVTGVTDTGIPYSEQVTLNRL